MDHQPKYKAQAKSLYFEDGAAMRTPVAGTVARGQLREDDAYYRGLKSDGTPIKSIPVPITQALLERGQERFNIYCSPCHSRVGDGRGIMIARGYVPPPTFHDERLRNIEDGYIFNVITNGIRNMPPYRYQVPVEDRWAIVAYMRALQRSQNATLDDIPTELRQEVR
jgi:mono/diheme cytochrome c family protein